MKGGWAGVGGHLKHCIIWKNQSLNGDFNMLRLNLADSKTAAYGCIHLKRVKAPPQQMLACMLPFQL